MDWSIAFQKRLKDLSKQSVPLSPPSLPKNHRPIRRPTAATAPKASYPLGQLIEDWKKCDEFRDLSEKTRKDYSSKMNALSLDHPDLWASEIDVLDRYIIKGVYKAARNRRGNAMARSINRTLSSAITWALKKASSRSCRSTRLSG